MGFLERCNLCIRTSQLDPDVLVETVADESLPPSKSTILCSHCVCASNLWQTSRHYKSHAQNPVLVFNWYPLSMNLLLSLLPAPLIWPDPFLPSQLLGTGSSGDRVLEGIVSGSDLLSPPPNLLPQSPFPQKQ